jgi:hypothetical protein
MNLPRCVGDPSSCVAYSDRNPAVVNSPARSPSAGSVVAVSDVDDSPVVGRPYRAASSFVTNVFRVVRSSRALAFRSKTID